MSTNVGKIHYDLNMNKKGFDSAHDEVVSKLGTLAKRFTILAGASAVAFAGFGIKIAGELESARSAFIGLFGSMEEADKTLARIKKEAKATPFEMTGLTQNVKQLASAVETGDEAIDILLNVGKAITASGGGQEELNRVVYNLKQIKGLGVLTGIDLKELRRAVPIFDKLVEASGTSIEKLQASTDIGTDLFKVFEEGGKKIYAVDKAFELQGGNFLQIVSNMKDDMAVFASDFVTHTGIFDLAKKAITGFSSAIQNNQDRIYNLANQFKELAKQAVEVGMQIWDYLKPKLMGLWAVISDELIPALKDLWENHLKGIAEILGVGLVIAVGLLIDSLAIALSAFSDISNWISNNEALFYGFIAIIGLLKAAMVFNAVVNAIIIQFNLLKLVHIPQLMASFGMLKAAIATPMVMPAIIAIAAFAVIQQLWDKYHALLNEISKSQDSAQTSREAYGKSLKARYERGEITAEERARLWKASALASGGVATAGKPYLVGERGPEMFIPRGTGTVKPANETAGMGGSVSIYGNINIGSQQDADNFFARLSRNQELSSKGLASMAGSVG